MRIYPPRPSSHHQAAYWSAGRSLFLAFVFPCLLSCATGRDNLLVATFDDAGSTFSVKLAELPATSIVKGEGVGGSHALKVAYEGFPQGSRPVITDHRLPFTAAEATLNYDVRFCEGFEFVKGGKLHGLGPAKPVTGGRAGGPENWSARVTFESGGRIATYLYHQDKPGQYGHTTTAKRFRFERDRFYAISLNVRVNDPPGEYNGHARIYVDGEQIVSHENVRFRAADGEGTLIREVLFHTFHGGHTEDFAPRNSDGSYRIECAFFDNIAVYPSLRIREVPGT